MKTPVISPAIFRRKLGAWFDRNQRKLPWRTNRSVYRTVVSEFMLQQTRVTTVLPYFGRWIRQLPDFPALAAASEAAVVKLWEGLGYYRRARNLHALARQVVDLPRPPRTAGDWQKLPGIGPYTAAAIASLCYGEPTACVDGNVVRILARLSGTRQPFADGSQAVKHFTPLATRLLDRKHPGRHNEAMMELGAVTCLRRQPRCSECPVHDQCVAGRGGFAGELPRIKRAAVEKQVVDRAWVWHRGRLLLHRIPDTAARMTGLFELPLLEQAGWKPSNGLVDSLLATYYRSITRFRITERIFAVPRPSGKLAPDLQWIPASDVDAVALSGPHRRWIAALLGSRNN